MWWMGWEWLGLTGGHGKSYDECLMGYDISEGKAITRADVRIVHDC